MSVIPAQAGIQIFICGAENLDADILVKVDRGLRGHDESPTQFN